MSLLEKLKTNNTIDQSSILAKSKLFHDKDMIPTPIPMINVALSGDVRGGLGPGVTEIAGPSKHFKSNFALLLMRAHQDKYKDGVILFYDSEFGTPKTYFQSFGIDQSRVIHSPITDVEILKIDIMKQINGLEKGDRVLIVIDSLGQLASRKEVDDVAEGKVVGDMSRPKAIKSLFRLVTPHLRLKDIPLIVINHTYKEIGMFPKDIAGGGTGPVFAADTIWFVGRQQDKDGTELQGYKFIITIEKSRFVKEKSKISVIVKFDEGIEKYSGLLEVALEGNYVTKPDKGWYTRPSLDLPDKATGKVKKYREDDTYTEEFWEPLLSDEKFRQHIRSTYEISSKPIYTMDQAVETPEDTD